MSNKSGVARNGRVPEEMKKVAISTLKSYKFFPIYIVMKSALLNVLGVYLCTHSWLFLYDKLIQVKVLGQVA